MFVTETDCTKFPAIPDPTHIATTPSAIARGGEIKILGVNSDKGSEHYSCKVDSL